LSGGGNAIVTEDAVVLHDIIIKESDLNNCVDIQQEKTAIERIEMINRYIISQKALNIWSQTFFHQLAEQMKVTLTKFSCMSSTSYSFT